MKKLVTILLLVFSLALHAQGPQTAINVPIVSGGGVTEPALLYLPDEYPDSTSKKYPLLIFLHGAGEAGTDLSKIYNSSTAGGPAYYIANNLWPIAGFTNPADGKSYKFIVVSPQATSWSTSAIQLNYIIPYLVSTYRVDTNRIYLTGLSAGGDGIVQYAGHHNMTPTYKEASWVPMSAATDPSFFSAETQAILGDSAHAWGFGSDPNDIHGIHTHQLMDSLNSYVSGFARFTNYSGGHCCWGQFYNPAYTESINGQSMSIYQWMLQYTRAAGISGGNQPPTVDAGADQTITLPVDSVTLSATASDPDGSIASYTWTKVSGPGTQSMPNPNNATAHVYNLQAGAYVFRCTVTDNEGATASDLVNVQVNPQGTTGSDTIQVNLYANGDPYGNTAWNDWAISSSNLSVSSLKYTTGTTSAIGMALSAHDNYGDNNSGYPTTYVPSKVGRYTSYCAATRTLTISGLDNGKIYDVYLFGSRLNSGYSTTYTIGGNSTTIAVGNNYTTAAGFTNVYPSGGSITATIANASGSSYNYLNAVILVEHTPSGGSSNQPPVANAGQDQTIVLPVDSVTLNGSGSTDDHTIVAYAWTKLTGSGGTITNASAAITTFTGLTAGTYTVELAVTDDSSATSRDTMQITVNAATNQPPVCDPGSTQNIRLPRTYAILNGTGSYDPDAGDSVVAYSWQVTGTPTGTVSGDSTTWSQPGGAAHTITPGTGYVSITSWAGYNPGDTIYLNGSFKSIDFENLSGAPGNYIVVMNAPGTVATVGDSTWSGGSWSQALILRNCHYVDIRGYPNKTDLQVVGSKSDSIAYGAPVKTAYFDVAFSNFTDNIAFHSVTVRDGGTGVWAKTEVDSSDSRTWWPNDTLSNFDFYNLEISNTYNEAMYIGHTATYWNIVTNQPYYPNPGDTLQNDTATYKRPIKLFNVNIHDCYVHDIGNDGIQTAAIDSLRIHDNTVVNWATKHGPNDNGGILIGGRVSGFDAYNNILHDSWGDIFQVYAEAGKPSYILNNLGYRNQGEGISMRGTDSLQLTIGGNTLAYIGQHCVRVNGYFGAAGPHILSTNIFAQPLSASGGTIYPNSYIYTENGGLASELAYPYDDVKAATVQELNLDESNYFKPLAGSSATGKGFVYKPSSFSGSTYSLSNADSSVATLSGLQKGTYTLRLTVTDSKGASTYQDILVNILNALPPYFKIHRFGRLKPKY